MLFPKSLIRNVPGWDDAPVPLCFGGDVRAITFCCDPRYPLAFESKCIRHAVLERIGLSEEEYIEIKGEFSDEFGWADERVCFRSLSFCCLRGHGCPRRDEVVFGKCGSFDDYFLKKRLLSVRLLSEARNKELVEPYIVHEKEKLKGLR
jgi:predicted metal-binding transcription factor (methanogenesis marker protein 9)